MHLLNRRNFLKRSTLGATGMLLGSLLNVPVPIRDAWAGGSGFAYDGKKLLFIFLRGGNDGLNMVVPGGDPAYYSNRPTLNIPLPSAPLSDCGTADPAPEAGRGIDLGNGFAMLNPNLHDLIPAYNAGEMAVIHRVGYADQSRSHFNSQHYWETGVPGDDKFDQGIFYRTLVELGLHETQDLPGVSFSSNLPLSLQGRIPMINIEDPNRYNLLGVDAAARQKHIDAIARMHNLPHPMKKNRPLTFGSGARFIQSINQVAAIDFTDNASPEFLDPGGNPLFPIDSGSIPLDGGNNPRNEFNDNSAFRFFRNVKNSCQILAGSDAVISGVELTGFDTHTNQGGVNGQHGELMVWLGYALASIRQYLINTNTWDDTVVVTLSEFGRTTVENGSAGTDHAEAGPMLVCGGGAKINGGIYECSPALTNPPCDDAASPSNHTFTAWVPGEGPTSAMFGVRDRYLKRTVDFRSILGEIICKHLGASTAQLERIIHGYANPAENLEHGGPALDGTPIVGELGLYV